MVRNIIISVILAFVGIILFPPKSVFASSHACTSNNASASFVTNNSATNGVIVKIEPAAARTSATCNNQGGRCTMVPDGTFDPISGQTMSCGSPGAICCGVNDINCLTSTTTCTASDGSTGRSFNVSIDSTPSGVTCSLDKSSVCLKNLTDTLPVLVTCSSSAPTATPTPTQIPAPPEATNTPTPTTPPATATPTLTPGNCTVTSAAKTGQTTGTATVDQFITQNGETLDRINWYLNGTFKFTSTVKTVNFSGLSPGTSYTVTAEEWKDGNTGNNKNCLGNPSFTTDSPGVTLTPTPTPTPTSVPQPLTQGQVRVRFYNEDGRTEYNGSADVWLLHDVNNDKNISRAENHNGLFYPRYWYWNRYYCTDNEGEPPATDDFVCTDGHNTNQGVGVCDGGGEGWHPYYDPGYAITAQGTTIGCPGQNMDNNAGNDRCMGTGSTDSSSSFPRCFSANPGAPHNARLSYLWAKSVNRDGGQSMDSTITFSVGAPTNYQLKVVRVDDFNSGDNPPADVPTRPVVKDYTSTVKGLTNYWASPWEKPDANTNFLGYDILVKAPSPTISGTVRLDDGDGVCEASDPAFTSSSVTMGVTGSSVSDTTTTDSSGNYSFTEGLTADDDGETYTVLLFTPDGYSTVPPGVTSQNVTLTTSSKQATNVDFCIKEDISAWFQTRDADIQASGNITSNIPTQCVADSQCIAELDLPGDYNNGDPGVPSAIGTTYFGQGSASRAPWGWDAENSGISAAAQRYKYSWFANKAPANVFTPGSAAELTGGTVSGGTLQNNSQGLKDADNYRWFYSNGTLTINSTANLDDEKVIVFVKGDLNIQHKITLKKGKGFFMAIVSGDINIDKIVSHTGSPFPADSAKPGLEGLYVADGQIKTGTTGSEDDNQLYVRGSLVGWGGINLERDRGTNNKTTPAEFVEYAPDLIFNFPPALRREGIIWREIAP